MRFAYESSGVKYEGKTVLFKSLETDMILSYDYAEIKEIISATEEKQKIS